MANQIPSSPSSNPLSLQSSEQETGRDANTRRWSREGGSGSAVRPLSEAKESSINLFKRLDSSETWGDVTHSPAKKQDLRERDLEHINPGISMQVASDNQGAAAVSDNEPVTSTDNEGTKSIEGSVDGVAKLAFQVQEGNDEQSGNITAQVEEAGRADSASNVASPVNKDVASDGEDSEAEDRCKPGMGGKSPLQVQGDKEEQSGNIAVQVEGTGRTAPVNKKDVASDSEYSEDGSEGSEVGDRCKPGMGGKSPLQVQGDKEEQSGNITVQVEGTGRTAPVNKKDAASDSEDSEDGSEVSEAGDHCKSDMDLQSLQVQGDKEEQTENITVQEEDSGRDTPASIGTSHKDLTFDNDERPKTPRYDKGEFSGSE